MKFRSRTPILSLRATVWLLLAGLVLWATFIVYCKRDSEAMKLAIILPPIFGTVLFLALRSRSMVLSMFMGFTFISHAIAPPFFFLHKTAYSYGGDFGAVKSFNFETAELLKIYGLVFTFTFGVLAFTMIGIRALGPPRGVIRNANQALAQIRRRTIYDVLIVLFIAAIAIPQSLLMFRLRVGITGLVAPVLPFRLTGILYYSRLFFYPVALFAAYTVAKRRWPASVAILAYALIGGLCGSSRYIVLVTAAPVVVFALIDGQKFRFAIAAAAAVFSFMVVTNSRSFVYTEKGPFRDYAMLSIRGDETQQRSAVDDLIGGIALRLYGPQDVVLAYQYDVDSRAGAMVRWFTGRPVVADLNYEFYGMTFAAGSGFGVGLGVCPWMIVVARRSYFILLLLSMVIAALLVSADRGAEAIKRSGTFLGAVVADPFAFFVVYVLYSSSILWCYELILMAFIGAMVLQLFAPIRRRVPHPMPPSLDVHGDLSAR